MWLARNPPSSYEGKTSHDCSILCGDGADSLLSCVTGAIRRVVHSQDGDSAHSAVRTLTNAGLEYLSHGIWELWASMHSKLCQTRMLLSDGGFGVPMDTSSVPRLRSYRECCAMRDVAGTPHMVLVCFDSIALTHGIPSGIPREWQMRVEPDDSWFPRGSRLDANVVVVGSNWMQQGPTGALVSVSTAARPNHTTVRNGRFAVRWVPTDVPTFPSAGRATALPLCLVVAAVVPEHVTPLSFAAQVDAPPVASRPASTRPRGSTGVRGRRWAGRGAAVSAAGAHSFAELYSSSASSSSSSDDDDTHFLVHASRASGATPGTSVVSTPVLQPSVVPPAPVLSMPMARVRGQSSSSSSSDGSSSSGSASDEDDDDEPWDRISHVVSQTPVSAAAAAAAAATTMMPVVGTKRAASSMAGSATQAPVPARRRHADVVRMFGTEALVSLSGGKVSMIASRLAAHAKAGGHALYASLVDVDTWLCDLAQRPTVMARLDAPFPAAVAETAIVVPVPDPGVPVPVPMRALMPMNLQAFVLAASLSKPSTDFALLMSRMGMLFPLEMSMGMDGARMHQRGAAEVVLRDHTIGAYTGTVGMRMDPVLPLGVRPLYFTYSQPLTGAVVTQQPCIKRDAQLQRMRLCVEALLVLRFEVLLSLVDNTTAPRDLHYMFSDAPSEGTVETCPPFARVLVNRVRAIVLPEPVPLVLAAAVAAYAHDILGATVRGIARGDARPQRQLFRSVFHMAHFVDASLPTGAPVDERSRPAFVAQAALDDLRGLVPNCEPADANASRATFVASRVRQDASAASPPACSPMPLARPHTGGKELTASEYAMLAHLHHDAATRSPHTFAKGALAAKAAAATAAAMEAAAAFAAAAPALVAPPHTAAVPSWAAPPDPQVSTSSSAPVGDALAMFVAISAACANVVPLKRPFLKRAGVVDLRASTTERAAAVRSKLLASTKVLHSHHGTKVHTLVQEYGTVELVTVVVTSDNSDRMLRVMLVCSALNGVAGTGQGPLDAMWSAMLKSVPELGGVVASSSE
jgi:hypothetical protein